MSIKNLMFAEGFDDFSVASCRLEGNAAEIKSACAEVGQGFVTLAQQIAREVLGIDDVTLAPIDTAIGSAGSSSASRQTWMSGGAVMQACEAVRDQLLAQVAERYEVAAELLACADGRVRSADGDIDLSLDEAAQGEPVFCEVTHRHAPTHPLDENGQGNAHVSFAFAAHRAVVDVDLDLGLIRVVEVATTQDVGKILNPLQALGQIEGGIAQGVGLAVMEDLQIKDGQVQNASFTDYLIPTALDMPQVSVAELIEQPEPRRALRSQRHRRTPSHLLVAGRSRSRAPSHRPGTPPSAHQPPRHRPGPLASNVVVGSAANQPNLPAPTKVEQPAKRKQPNLT